MFTFERFLALRYLKRSQPHPKILGIGYLIFGLGVLCFIGAHILEYYSLQHQENAIELEFQLKQWAQGVQVVGLVCSIVSVLTILFGLLNTFLTTFSAFSTFMIATGVAEVILVLGVMNGFQGYLREKLIAAHAHISIEPQSGQRWIPQYQEIMDEARRVEGVLGVSPLIQAEVMLRVNQQDLTSAIQVLGVDPRYINETTQVNTFLKEGCGCLKVLETPVLLDQYFKESNSYNSYQYCDQICTLSSEQPKQDKALASNTPSSALTSMMAIPPPKLNQTTPTLILGVQLRYNLGLSPNQSFELISPLGDLGPNGPLPKIKTFRVGGWVNSGLVDVDSHLAYGHLKELQRFSGVGDVVNEIRVRTPSIHDARAVRDRLRAQLGNRVQVRDWQERNQGLFSALKLERIAMFLVLTINILLAAFSIISTLVMTLIERKREIAILNAMGTPRRSLVSIFVYQGFFTGLIGSYLGTMIGVGSCIAIRMMGLPLNAEEIYYINSIPVEVHALDVGLIVCVALSVSLLSTIYPAYFASKIQPVEGLKGR